jgi:hypothetical protein
MYTIQYILGFPNTLRCYLNFTDSKVLFSKKIELQISKKPIQKIRKRE